MCGMNEAIANNNIGFTPVADPELEAMLKAGVHLGHSKSKNHPAMQPYIFGVRNTISVIDLTATKEKLAEAQEFLKKIAARGGLILLVGTRPAARQAILEVAGKTKMPYFTERWIGGTLTNFKVVSKRIEYMENLERQKASGELGKYTKKERMKKEEEIEKLKKNFDGLRNLKRIPDALFVVDITEDTTAVREAKIMGLPVIALVDTNSDASLINYPIPSNDDALSAVKLMVGKIGEAIEAGLQEGQKEAKKEEQKQENK